MGFQADPARRHILLDDRRGRITPIVQRAGEIFARVIENIAAAPIDEFEQAQHREAEAEAIFHRLLDILGARHPLFHQASRFVHGDALNARHDIAGARGADHGHLADTLQHVLQALQCLGARLLARRKFHQGHDEGRVQPMGVEKALGMLDRRRQIVDQDRRCRRGNDR